ncbi:MAG TPA: hypothetical protein VN520_35005 [Streptomyces sp.]|uniref:hypothetical protein n=1 Tax=Streptomyces sp. TaxID=1931 RepID=UPI002CAC6647|nr:hypothetical protein [Streptomyces sp.]HWU11506.1 hypothetical protein [Streptomyces sp.]
MVSGPEDAAESSYMPSSSNWVTGMVFSEYGEVAWTARKQRRSQLLQHLVGMAGVLLASRGGAQLLQILKG